jgi:hypothetical protein
MFDSVQLGFLLAIEFTAWERYEARERPLCVDDVSYWVGLPGVYAIGLFPEGPPSATARTRHLSEQVDSREWPMANPLSRSNLRQGPGRSVRWPSKSTRSRTSQIEAARQASSSRFR